MTLVLDGGGVTALAGQRARLAELRRRNAWPPVVPAVVLAECLTGDHRRDVVANQLLRMCVVRDVDGRIGRDAARLRTAIGRAGTLTAVDAIVVAVAAGLANPVVLTADPDDLGALAASQPARIVISRA